MWSAIQRFVFGHSFQIGFGIAVEYQLCVSIDDLLSGVSREKKSDLAEKLIRDCLSDGRYPQQALMDKAKHMDISKRIIDEVKKRLNVRSVKDGNQWFWQLPDELPL